MPLKNDKKFYLRVISISSNSFAPPRKNDLTDKKMTKNEEICREGKKKADWILNHFVIAQNKIRRRRKSRKNPTQFHQFDKIVSPSRKKRPISFYFKFDYRRKVSAFYNFSFTNLDTVFPRHLFN